MTLVAEISKNSRETTRVERTNFQGTELVNIRVWFRADDGELRPSKKGLAIRLEHAEAVAGAILKAASLEVNDGR